MSDAPVSGPGRREARFEFLPRPEDAELGRAERGIQHGGDLLLARRNTEKSFKPLPAFPTIRRDVAMLVPEALPHERVLSVVKQAKPANLESVELFDVFRGKNVPEGQKSLAYAFTYRSPERTLTDEEVNAAHQQLIAQLKESLQATIRET